MSALRTTAVFVLSLLCADFVFAGEFRLYTANKLLQQRQIKPWTNMERAGCHDFILKRRIYRVAQIGFEHCIVYSEKECKAGSELPVRWKGTGKQIIEFTRGALWYLDEKDKRGFKVGSWYCEAEKTE